MVVQGVDAAFDEAEAEISLAENDLKKHLREVQDRFDAGGAITYISLQKESHLLEIPQVLPVEMPPALIVSADDISPAGLCACRPCHHKACLQAWTEASVTISVAVRHRMQDRKRTCVLGKRTLDPTTQWITAPAESFDQLS